MRVPGNDHKRGIGRYEFARDGLGGISTAEINDEGRRVKARFCKDFYALWRTTYLSANVMIKLIDHEFLFVNNTFYKISN